MVAFNQKLKSNPSNPSAFNSRKGEDFFGVQAKLSVGKSNDKYEAEADHVADKIVSHTTQKSAEPFFTTSTQTKNQATQIHKKENNENEIQQKPLAELITPVTPLQSVQKCNCDKENVQKKDKDESQNDIPNPNFESQLNSSKGGGMSLSSTIAKEMESGFGTDFRNIRIHNDSSAVQMSEEIGAQAFANGNDIYFNKGKYDPNSQSGKHLLAHELTHTVQQTKNDKKSIQRKTFRETSSTVAFIRGPIWNLHLTITNAPDEDTEKFIEFIETCHDGVMDAARTLGTNPSVTSREIRVRLRYNSRFDEDAISQQAYQLALASLPRPPQATTTPSATVAPRRTVIHVPVSSKTAPANETDADRLRRQTSTTLGSFANTVADAGAEGYNRIVLTVQNDGGEIYPGFAKEQQVHDPSMVDQTSAYNVRDLLTLFSDQFTSGAGRWEIVFTRQGNAMRFSSFRTVPEQQIQAPWTEEDELRSLGIPNRREIYASIFQETQRQLQEVGIAIAGFTIEQLVVYVAGGLLFKGLALLGRGVVGTFPRIMAVISRGTPAALAPGLEVLSVAERNQFGVLMTRVESGALNAAERTQLQSFLARIESALTSAIPRSGAGATQLMSRISAPSVTSLNGTLASLDRELIRRAMEYRATQAGITLEAFTNYNVAVARVRTASGEVVYLEAGNRGLGGAHSEEYILSQFESRVMGLGPGARLEQLYSERIPCGNCSSIITRFFGAGTEIFYSVGNQRNRGQLLMRQYGL